MRLTDVEAQALKIAQLHRLGDLTQEQWTTYGAYVRALAGEYPGPVRWLLAFVTVANLWSRGLVPVHLIPPRDFSAAEWLDTLAEPDATRIAHRVGLCIACRAEPHSAGRPRCNTCHAAWVRGEGR